MADSASTVATAAVAQPSNKEGSTTTSCTAFDYARNPEPTTFDYFTQRYYHQYCIENCKNVTGNNVRLLQHSNGLCLVCLDPSHVALAALKADPTLSIASIVFGSGRSHSAVTPDNIKVVGKRKKNALLCQLDTKLCTLTLSNGATYAIPTCLNGFLLELNAALLQSPWLAAAAPTAEGFLAIVNPSAKNDFASMKKAWTATGGDAQGEDED